MPRVLVMVLDSAGIGALPDAADYGDAPGANTLGNTAEYVGGLRMPNSAALGLGNLTSIRGVPASERPVARVARVAELSRGKDTITGHWEMAGIVTEVAFPTYPDGFPSEVVAAFAEITGRPPLGNRPASGTGIIAELGDEHVRTGRAILYTSADSVFQVAAHEDVVALATLYAWCEAARAMLVPPHAVNRVIARPFRGPSGAYERTANRRDYALAPPANVLDRFAAAGVAVHAVGKICDIYCGRGITTSVRVADNAEALERTCELLDRTETGIVFVNLNDFDSKYGHRRDARGYARALEEFDASLPRLLERLRPGDHAVFTADHGCDPTAPGTDHTREYVPLLHVGGEPGLGGTLRGLAAVGQIMEDAFCEQGTRS